MLGLQALGWTLWCEYGRLGLPPVSLETGAAAGGCATLRAAWAHESGIVADAAGLTWGKLGAVTYRESRTSIHPGGGGTAGRVMRISLLTVACNKTNQQSNGQHLLHPILWFSCTDDIAHGHCAGVEEARG